MAGVGARRGGCKSAIESQNADHRHLVHFEADIKY